MKSLIVVAKVVPMVLILVGCGSGSRLVKETCGGLVVDSSAAVERSLAGRTVGTYSGEGPAKTPGTYLTGPVRQYATRDDGSAIIDSVAGYEYKGELKNGKPHGVGIATYSCKKIECTYAGEWRNGTKHGNGVMRIGDNCYVGEWSHDEPHGQGTHYDVHVYHGLGTTVGVFRDGRGWNTENYNDDVLVGRTRNGDYAMAEEYFQSRRDRQRIIEQRTTAIMEAIMKNIE